MKTMLWYAVSAMACKYLNKVSIPKKNTYTLPIFVCVGCMGFIYLSAEILELYTSVMVRIWLFFGFASIAVAFTIYFYMAECKEEQKNTELLEMRNSLLEENYKTISSIYTSHAKLYHDLNNHLNVLYQMLDENKIKDAKTYIEKISEPVAKLSKTTWTGIDLVDMVLNSKIEKIQENGINIDINVEFPRNTNIQPHDLCTILGNLIDNAIEATEKSYMPGNIAICIRKINHFVVIQVSNPCAGNKGEYIGLPVTSKRDVKLHGWGLLSVADAVKKYNGTLKCKNENDRFVATAMLFFRKLPGTE
ncbi:MAG: GHKL domain-containing protein [Eubacterium sp.]|nr:GHKL domain-containing protein [Eubacterium sp.]